RNWETFAHAKSSQESALRSVLQRSVDERDETLRKAAAEREGELAKINAKHEEKHDHLHEALQSSLKKIERSHAPKLNQLEQARTTELKQAQAAHERRRHAAEHEAETGKRELALWRDSETKDAEADYEQTWTRLEEEWREFMPSAEQEMIELQQARNKSCLPWSDESWADFVAGSPDASPVGVGWLPIDLERLEGGLPEGDSRFVLPSVRSVQVPLTLEVDGVASLLIKAPREGRDRALDTVRSAMLRVLSNLPAGKVRFTMVDPVGLGQSFSAFMHLGDANDLLVSGKIWTEPRHIEQRLADLSEHIENVIQRYLRNEYASIEDYNRDAGEIAEAYRFLVIADLPTNFTEESAKRLAGIIKTGPRCGVHTFIVMDPKEKLPAGLPIEDIEDASIVIEADREHYRKTGEVVFLVNDEVFGQHELVLGDPPADALLTTLLKRIGEASTDASRVEVPFRAIAPKEEEYWSRSSAADLKIPLGRTGATRRQEMVLGHGTAQHALIAGKTGSGKSTLLHAMITSAAAWYSPRELEVYLIDFKAGVEFKTYATNRLPHARVVSIETDRGFGLSVLQRVSEELGTRGDRFRALGVQNVAGFREAAPDEAMPRILLIIDEFQELFTQDDSIAQEAALLLDRLVRQGRAFGIHVVLGS
ncbi:MAG: FtsK/SpoIIIE domain-containing protein, partial [Planctomycetota bacterium]